MNFFFAHQHYILTSPVARARLQEEKREEILLLEVKKESADE